jgi:hypothetical protein
VKDAAVLPLLHCGSLRVLLLLSLPLASWPDAGILGKLDMEDIVGRTTDPRMNI